MRRHCNNPDWRVLTAILVASFILSAWPGVTVAGEADGFPATEAGTRQDATNTTISTYWHKFDFLEGEPELPPELMAPEPESGVIGLYIIHIAEPTTQDMLETIQNLGITISRYVPNNAYQVRMTPEQAQPAENLSFVDWVGFYHPAYKISPIHDDALEVAVQLTGPEIPGTAIDFVRSRFISIEWDKGGDIGGDIGGFIKVDHHLVGTVASPEALIEIVANPYVQYIFLNNGNTTISVNGYVFDVLEGEPELPPDLIAQPPESGEIGLYMLHISSSIKQYMLDAIEALNITIAGYVPFNAYKVRMTPEQALLAENLSFVDWVGFYHPAYKISGDLKPGQLELAVWLYGQEIPYEAILEVRSKFDYIEWEGYLLGDGVRDEYSFKGTLSSPEAITEIAHNPYVNFIYPILEGQFFNEDNQEYNYLPPVMIIIAILCAAVTIIFIRNKRRKEAN